MSNDHFILCGGLIPTGLPDNCNILRLNLWDGGDDENVQLKIEDLHETLYRNIPEQFFDLVEIAAYVYCADQAIKRTGQDTDTFGDSWRRSLKFHIPVRCIDLWNRADIKQELVQLLNFLSDDDFSFHFSQAERAPQFQQYLEFSTETHSGRDFERVVMFSGGLDSLAGVVEETLVNKSRVVLVTHESTPKNTRLVRELHHLLAEKAGPLKPLRLRVRANKKKRLGKEYTQRTRSFLFASFGVAVAKMMGLDTLRFYENGVISLNLPVSAQVIGSRATRTTHPRTLAGFQNLFSLLGEAPFTVENPFLLSTKVDVIQKIIKASGGEMIDATTSCAHTWERTNEYTHCGVCSQCIDRRLAVAAANAEQFDQPSHYRKNLFLDPRPDDEDKMMLAAYLDRATAVDEVQNASDFIAAFPQIVDAFPFVQGGATKIAGQFFDLYKRHAHEVNEALDLIIKAHSSALVQGVGGAGCLLRTLVDGRGIELTLPQVPSDFGAVNIFRRTGNGWQIRFQGGDLFALNKMAGMDVIWFLLRNPGQEFEISEISNQLAGIDEDFAPVRSRGSQAKSIRDLPTDAQEELKDLLRDKEAAEESQEHASVQRLSSEIDDLLKRYGVKDSHAKVLKREGDDAATEAETTYKAIGRVFSAIKKTEGLELLAEHLSKHLQRRPPFGYTPDQPVVWQT